MQFVSQGFERRQRMDQRSHVVGIQLRNTLGNHGHTLRSNAFVCGPTKPGDSYRSGAQIMSIWNPAD
jgi:hypothetical protein